MGKKAHYSLIIIFPVWLSNKTHENWFPVNGKFFTVFQIFTIECLLMIIIYDYLY